MKKLKLNMLVGAVAFAIAGSASALNVGATGDSSVILDVYDSTTGTTFVKDLGLNLSDLFNASTTSFSSINLSSDQNWQTFVSTVGGVGNVSNDIYNIIALDTVDNDYLTTSNSPLATISALTNAQLKQFSGVDQFLAATNAIEVGTSSVYTATSTPNFADFNYSQGVNWQGKAGNVDSTATVGTDISFYNLSLNPTGNPNLAKIVVTQNTAISEFDFTSNGVLSAVAAVPEAKTWMMMLVGFGVIGASTRRRRNRIDALPRLQGAF